MEKKQKEFPFNKRAEYEVQATNGMEHDFPQIAQGLSRAEAERLKREYEHWYRNPDA